jgi:hypothetical protein
VRFLVFDGPMWIFNMAFSERSTRTRPKYEHGCGGDCGRAPGVVSEAEVDQL